MYAVPDKRYHGRKRMRMSWIPATLAHYKKGSVSRHAAETEEMVRWIDIILEKVRDWAAVNRY